MTVEKLPSQIKKSFSPVTVVKHLNNKNEKLCACPSAQPGKIKADVSAHLSTCPIRKKLVTEQFTVNTSVVPRKWHDGYSLRVALTD